MKKALALIIMIAVMASFSNLYSFVPYGIATTDEQPKPEGNGEERYPCQEPEC